MLSNMTRRTKDNSSKTKPKNNRYFNHFQTEQNVKRQNSTTGIFFLSILIFTFSFFFFLSLISRNGFLGFLSVTLFISEGEGNERLTETVMGQRIHSAIVLPLRKYESCASAEIFIFSIMSYEPILGYHSVLHFRFAQSYGHFQVGFLLQFSFA